MTAASVEATAISTMAWLREQTEIAVPVYQRQYRWDVDRCRRLLDDIRAAGDDQPASAHFIGSILATHSEGDGPTVLIDGQQRITTLVLLVAAVRDALRASHSDRAADLHLVLEHPDRQRHPRLQLHEQQQAVLASLLFGHDHVPLASGESALEDNYRFLLAEVRHDTERVSRGLDQLEQVVISLGEGSNPQQVFESLNSTSAPLNDHELVHNYVLMGLPYERQLQVHTTYWQPIEENTGEFIDEFLRNYLIQRTGRDSQFSGEHGVHEAFKSEFPNLSSDSIDDDAYAPEWLEYSQVYRDLLDPNNPNVRDIDVRRQLHNVNTFGTAMYPIVMVTYRDWIRGDLTKAELLATLDQLQALYLRRMVVGLTRDHLAAQLCRRRKQYGVAHLQRDIARRSPSDDRVRNALRYRPIPHAGYVLRRLDPSAEHLNELGDLEVEHIFPQGPGATWSAEADGPIWSTFPVEEQARYLELANTLGNLVLLEQHLNAGASNRPFAEKYPYYEQSEVAFAKELALLPRWDRAAIEQRTQRLTDRFLQVWSRPADEATDLDADQLTPILDAERRPGYYPGWKSELTFARFQGEIWEVRNHKELYNRVFKRLWSSRRQGVLDYSAAHGGPVSTTTEPGQHFDTLGDGHFLYMGFFPQYALGEVQGILDELGIADEVFVRYATSEE